MKHSAETVASALAQARDALAKEKARKHERDAATANAFVRDPKSTAGDASAVAAILSTLYLEQVVRGLEGFQAELEFIAIERELTEQKEARSEYDANRNVRAPYVPPAFHNARELHARLSDLKQRHPGIAERVRVAG